MNWKFWETEDQTVEVMDKILEELRVQDPNSQEFATNLTYLERITKLKDQTKRKVPTDAIVAVVGNLLVVGAIVAYEQKHALTSKGMLFVKPKTPTI